MKVCGCCGAPVKAGHAQCENCKTWAGPREVKPPSIKDQIEYATRQFEVYKMYALYWQAMAMTGAATMRELAQGRPATTEEKAAGITIGFDELTPEQKVKEALDTMNRFIHLMMECNDTISTLKEKL